LIEQGIYWHLTQTVGVSSLVSTRIYPALMPQNPTFPCLTYQRISTHRYRIYHGAGQAAAPRFQIDSWAVSYAGAKALAAAVRVALDGYHGSMSPVTVGACEIVNETDVYDEEARVYRVIQDYRILHNE
jgi:hypothetical protein